MNVILKSKAWTVLEFKPEEWCKIITFDWVLHMKGALMTSMSISKESNSLQGHSLQVSEIDFKGVN
mgnify:CR=1 FL=1